MSSYHPDGLTVDIVGIIASNRGRNCDEHPFCGEIVQESANVSRGFLLSPPGGGFEPKIFVS